MAHLKSSVAALSAFRSATSIRAPTNKRFFTPSAFNMVKKAYFDCTWTGPEVQVDQQGNTTKTGPVKGKLPMPLHTSIPPASHAVAQAWAEDARVSAIG